MNFLNPWFAAAVAGVVIPALLLLYFLKLRRREQLVPSTLLWKRAVHDLQVNAPFQRLRRSLLLILQLLVLALVIGALARPIVKTPLASASRLVVLIDRSASMNTVEGDKTRLELAKEQAIRQLRTINQRTGGWRSFLSLAGATARTQAMVISYTDRAAVVSGFSTDVSELTRLIEEIQPSDGRTSLREALDLAERYMAPPTRTTDQTPVSAEDPAELLLISDGRVPDAADLVIRSGSARMVRVGQASDNVGVTVLRAQRNHEEPELVDVFIRVRNFGPAPVNTDVSLFVDGVVRTVRWVQLGAYPQSIAEAEQGGDANAPGGPDGQARGRMPATAEIDDTSAAALSVPLLLDQSAVLEARLSRADALATDNSAWVVVPPPRRKRVLVVTDGRYPFLGSVMRGLPLQEHLLITPGQYESQAAGLATDGQSNFDAVIFDKYAPETLPAGNFVFLGALPKVEEIKPGDAVTNHPLIWWDETHPILRHVALDHVFVAESRTVTVPPAAEILVEGPRGPVLFRYAKNGRQYLVQTFAVEQSDWVSKVSFPVFVYNAIQYLGGGGDAGAGAVRPGQPLRIPFPAGTEQLRLVGPDGSGTTLAADAEGLAFFGATERVGVYRAPEGIPGRNVFAVNLEDEAESHIAPSAEPLRIGAAGVVQELKPIETSTPEVWRWFAGVALALLVLEWWIYNRRVLI